MATAAAAPDSKPDYTKWTQEALISRIQLLESSLSAAALPLPPPRRYRPFNASSHPTRPIALKLSYLGGAYHGFEHSPGAPPTIESALFRAFLKSRLVPCDASMADPEALEAWPGDENVGYSKCGRTDRGVSAFGQVVGITVRSNGQEREGQGEELDYCGILNKLLPKDIRILSWAPDVKKCFNARFDCRGRTYRYYFCAPHCVSISSDADVPRGLDGKLDVAAMDAAASYFLGTHDFRNFCKLDASKQLTNFTRVITTSRIVPVSGHANMFYFELHGTAFLWHQVRHMVAILFLVGQGLETPEVVRDMLDLGEEGAENKKFARKPVYEMADDRPLVLWECDFASDTLGARGWVRAGREKLVESVWEGWYGTRIDQVMNEGLAGLVGIDTTGSIIDIETGRTESDKERKRRMRGHALCVGDGRTTMRGQYLPLEKRECIRSVEQINKAWVERKGGGWREIRARKKRAREDEEAVVE